MEVRGQSLGAGSLLRLCELQGQTEVIVLGCSYPLSHLTLFMVLILLDVAYVFHVYVTPVEVRKVFSSLDLELLACDLISIHPEN